MASMTLYITNDETNWFSNFPSIDGPWEIVFGGFAYGKPLFLMTRFEEQAICRPTAQHPDSRE
jgi:hypothetical protein